MSVLIPWNDDSLSLIAVWFSCFTIPDRAINKWFVQTKLSIILSSTSQLLHFEIEFS